MNRYSALAVIVALTVIALPGSALADNSVFIESKMVPFGISVCTLGVYLSNDLPIVGLALTLQTRSLAGNAYLGGGITSANCRLEAIPEGRVHNSPLGPAGPNWPTALISSYVFATPAGACQDPGSSGLTTFRLSTPVPDTLSPDGFLYGAFSFGDPNAGELIELSPGSDPIGTPSFRLLLSLNGRPGRIAIDPCCVSYASVTSFFDYEASIYYPTVTSGSVTCAECACDCHANPVCDNVKSDILDLVTTINVAFRGTAPLADPNASCPRLPNDVDCSNSTDVIDVVKVTNVAFRGADVANEYCEPCL